MDAPLGAPSPQLFEGDERDDGVPGAAKNTGDDAWLFENCIGASGRQRKRLLMASIPLPGLTGNSRILGERSRQQ
jgi:hypothetical protein